MGLAALYPSYGGSAFRGFQEYLHSLAVLTNFPVTIFVMLAARGDAAVEAAVYLLQRWHWTPLRETINNGDILEHADVKARTKGRQPNEL